MSILRLVLVLSLVVCAGCQTPETGIGDLGLGPWRGRPHLDPAEEARMSPDAHAIAQRQWNAEVLQHWRMDGAELVNDGEGAFLTTERSFGDAEFEFDYRTVALADSGIYLRGNPQVQIWDTTESGGKWHLGADKGSGGLWNNQRHLRTPLIKADRPFGEWNQLKIRQAGACTWVWLNGQLTVDGVPMENYFAPKLPLPRTGPLQLQTHGGEIRFRNFRMREVGMEEADQWLRAAEGSGFQEIPLDKELSAFDGAKDAVEADGQVLRWRAGKGGNLFTKSRHGDFSLRFEFRLPPGGNNGILLRYPGAGDGAYAGFCECQVLDDGHPMYKDLQPWQAHGSAYGIVPAARGYLRPTGTWNHECITLRGKHLTVTLNGTIILDADVDKPLHDQAHPGLALTEGHIGFGGHGDAVEFRNLAVKDLR